MHSNRETGFKQRYSAIQKYVWRQYIYSRKFFFSCCGILRRLLWSSYLKESCVRGDSCILRSDLADVASNPGPHHHRICDRREEGLVKPPFCFASFPTIVWNISHSNYLAKSAVFKSVFDSQKRRGARPAQAELVKVQTQGKTQLGARRRLNMVKKGAEERTKTFWFRNRWLFGPWNLQSALNEMFSFLFFLFPFFLVPFFFCRTFTCWGKHQSPALREQHQFRTRSVGEAWSWSACTVRQKGLYILAKQCVSSERCAMLKACSVCHHGNKVEQTQQTKLSLQDVGLVVFLNLARRSLFFVKHGKRTDKATNHNDCTNNF